VHAHFERVPIPRGRMRISSAFQYREDARAHFERAHFERVPIPRGRARAFRARANTEMHILSAFQYCEDAREHFERAFRACSNTARMNRILKRSDGKRCTHNLCCESIWLGIGLVLRASHQSTFGLIVGVSQAYFYYRPSRPTFGPFSKFKLLV